MCRPQTCPACGCPLGYRAAVCDTCHAHYQICHGPGGQRATAASGRGEAERPAHDNKGSGR
jgi:hypothetical protein